VGEDRKWGSGLEAICRKRELVKRGTLAEDKKRKIKRRRGVIWGKKGLGKAYSLERKPKAGPKSGDSRVEARNNGMEGELSQSSF